MNVGGGATQQLKFYRRAYYSKAGKAVKALLNDKDSVAFSKRRLIDENQILSRAFAVLTRLQLKFYALPFREAGQSGALYCRNMDECVF